MMSQVHPPNPDVSNFGMLVLPKEGCCFHCGEPLPKRAFDSVILGQSRAMCCLGCKLAADSIVEAGLEQYYLDRQEISRVAALPDELTLKVYDHEDIKHKFTYQEGDKMVAELSVVGLRCAACSWLIESRLDKLDGVVGCQVNLTSQRMQVAWRDEMVSIGTILATIAQIGYDAKPYRQDTHNADLKRHNKTLLIRLGIAAIGAMQAMMFAIGTYFGDVTGIDSSHRVFLQYVSMVAALPVLCYAAIPFFASAMTAIKARQVNMDIPVSIALVLTFLASAYALISHQGETYFDSVAMFVFFLLAGRYLEGNARLRVANMANDLVSTAPILVQKVGFDSTLWQKLEASDDKAKLCQEALLVFSQNPRQPVHEVGAGDVVWVGAGDTLLGDGILLSPCANVFQSVMTGESDLVGKVAGETLLGGSQNDATPFFMLITKDQQDSQLALIDRLIARAMGEKPKIAQEADKMAKWFVARVLVLAILVFVGWWFVNPDRAVWATVAVLVATCPCALSLATPMVLTVATHRLAQKGLLVTRGHTISTLAKITHVAFDKTGTLTTGTPNLSHIEACTELLDSEQLLAMAAALEVGSRHPVAQSLQQAARQLHLPAVLSLTHYAGGGVQGIIDNKVWRIGNAQFLGADLPALDKGVMAIGLGVADDGNRFVVQAWFYFYDSLRSDTQALVAQLKKQNITPIMLTGDPSPNAKKLGEQLGLVAHTGLLPEDKLAHIEALQQEGAVVLMVGDGVNDAPVLAGSDVSSAMAGATDLAQVSADSVVLSDTLTPIVDGITIAKKTQTIINQNLKWAFFYNIAIIIPAALGYVPPYLAALGMSLSSLLVVLNALRIKKA